MLHDAGIGKIKSMKESAQKFIKQLSSGDQYKRLMAAGKLALLDEKAVPALIKKLGMPGGDKRKWIIRVHAAVALSWIGYKAIPSLAKALAKDRDWHIRAGAAEVFGMLRREETVPYLVKALNDRHFKVRKYSIFALRRIDNREKEIVKRLKALIADDPNQEVREATAETLRMWK